LLFSLEAIDKERHLVKQEVMLEVVGKNLGSKKELVKLGLDQVILPYGEVVVLHLVQNLDRTRKS
jgi:hypothetical protein